MYELVRSAVSSMRRRAPTSGFTLTELMIVVAIVGILAAFAAPSFTKDRSGRESRDLASDVARELQKCRSEALSTGLGVRAFVFSNRIELRPYVAGATAGAAPRVPTTADPVLRILNAPTGITFTGVVVTGGAAPSSGTLTTVVHADVDFSTQGSAQYVGQAVPTGAIIFLQNANLPPTSDDYDFRIDITALTAYVSVRTN